MVVLGLPGGSDSKETACNVGDWDLIPQLGRSPRERNGYPLQYSSLENSMDRGVWQAIAHVHYYKRPNRDLPHLCLEYRMAKKPQFIRFFSLSSYFLKIGVQLPQNVVLVSVVQPSESAIYICVYIHTHSLVLGFSSHLSNHRALRRVSYAIRSVLGLLNELNGLHVFHAPVFCLRYRKIYRKIMTKEEFQSY